MGLFSSFLKIFKGNGGAKTNPYASVVQGKVAKQVELNADLARRAAAERAAEERRARYDEMFEQAKKDIRKDQEEALRREEERFREETEDWKRRMQAEQDAIWWPVSSSNVDAIRWLGKPFGLNVRFKKGTKKFPGRWLYYYDVAYSTFEQMRDAPSKGKFIWMLRRTGVPYLREFPSTIPPRIIYPWGAIGTKPQG